jgi:drug/metabolite transporter (DMT)-like permease
VTDLFRLRELRVSESPKQADGAHRIGVILILVFVNLLWAGNPVMAKFALEAFTPLQVSWLRLTGATLALAMAYPWLRRKETRCITRVDPGAFGKLVLSGIVVFYMTPLLSMNGLDRSLATHSAFITGLEPVSTILFACVFLNERMLARQWGILAIAVMGFVLLSGVMNQWAGVVSKSYLLGNSLLLLATFGESVFSVVGGGLVNRIGPARVLMIALISGWTGLTLHMAFTNALPVFAGVETSAWLGIAWVGPVTTAFCYFIWFAALQEVPVNVAAFTLFFQPVVGGTLGHLVLGEQPSSLEWSGGGLIIFALTLHAIHVVRSTPKKASKVGRGVLDPADQVR